jgi:hypothetical protein
MRRATAVLTLTAVLVVAGAGVAAGAGARTRTGGFGRAYVPGGMAVYEWHQAGELPAAEVAGRLRFLRANGFRTVFLEIGDYLDAAELAPGTPGRQALLDRIRHRIQRFVAMASDAGIAVQALGGGPGWTGELRYLGQKLVQLVASYNLEVGRRERLQGVQLDIEPYTLDGWFADPAAGLAEYLTMAADVVATYRTALERSVNRHLQLGFAVPFWFDARGDAPGPVAFDGATKPAVHHLIDLVGDLPGAYLVVMAYRDFTGTSNGSIAHARDEFRYAAASGARSGLVVGQQYGPAGPQEQHITFHGQPRRDFRRAAAAITTAFRRYPQFRGLAVDDVDAYLAADP